MRGITYEVGRDEFRGPLGGCSFAPSVLSILRGISFEHGRLRIQRPWSVRRITHKVGRDDFRASLPWVTRSESKRVTPGLQSFSSEFQFFDVRFTEILSLRVPFSRADF